MAAVMMGAAGLTGCSNESVVEEQAPVNPTYNGESVKTQFAINIPYANPSKRMTGDNTQQDGKNFLGMSNIRLIPYKDGTPWDGAISKILALGDIDPVGTVSPDPSETTKKYQDVDIPVGTTKFLFYGEGTKTGADEAEKNKNNGALVATIDGLTSRDDISFALKKVYEGTDFGDAQTALIALLNGVQNASESGGTTWASYASSGSTSGNAYILKNLYNNYITMKAGSANSILTLMQALYTELDKFDNAIGGTDEKVAAAIMAAITKSDGYTSGTATVKIINGSGTLSMDFKLNTSTDVSTFPRNLGLPDGAVRVKFESNAFESNNFTLTVGGAQAVDIKNITYPASLYYFVDSELGAKDDAAATFPAAGSWGAEAWSGWGSSVTASTRVIAMKEPVEYGVGLLATKVKLSSLTLLDNKSNTLTFSDNPFELTGVLIGGQPNSVKWNMVQAYDDVTGNRTQTIYDAAVEATTTVSTSDMATPNYTLALDNSKFTDANGTRETAANQDNVSIAIELVNNSGQNFEGVDGTVYAGATFYLVAQLDPDGTGVTNDDQKSVFMQDYKTTANLTVNSLKNAYNVLPDLRSTTLQFGLAVDLDWKTGLTFDVAIE